jgi:hypothetical protein
VLAQREHLALSSLISLEGYLLSTCSFCLLELGVCYLSTYCYWDIPLVFEKPEPRYLGWWESDTSLALKTRTVSFRHRENATLRHVPVLPHCPLGRSVTDRTDAFQVCFGGVWKLYATRWSELVAAFVVVAGAAVCKRRLYRLAREGFKNREKVF